MVFSEIVYRCSTSNHFWAVYEYCPSGTLQDIIKSDKNFPLNSILLFAIDIINGLYTLHRNGIIYCNFTPSTLIFNEFGILKLFNFELSKRIEQTVKYNVFFISILRKDIHSFIQLQKS